MFHRAKSTFFRFAVDFFNIVNYLCMMLFGKKERKSFIFDCSSIMNENWIFTIWFFNSWFLTTFYHLQEWCSILNHEFLFTVQKMFLFLKKKNFTAKIKFHSVDCLRSYFTVKAVYILCQKFVCKQKIRLL